MVNRGNDGKGRRKEREPAFGLETWGNHVKIPYPPND
jgi:hypothetical protein